MPVHLQPSITNTYKAEIERIRAGFREPTTGLYSFGALLFFLEYEFQWALRSRHSISMLVFTPNFENLYVQKSMANGMQVEKLILQSVEQVKRTHEMLAHFEDGHYAIIMRGTNLAGSTPAINRMLRQLAKAGLKSDPNSGSNPIHAVVVSLPGHAEDVLSLITAAKSELRRVEDLCLQTVGDEP